MPALGADPGVALRDLDVRAAGEKEDVANVLGSFATEGVFFVFVEVVVRGNMARWQGHGWDYS